MFHTPYPTSSPFPASIPSIIERWTSCVQLVSRDTPKHVFQRAGCYVPTIFRTKKSNLKPKEIAKAESFGHQEPNPVHSFQSLICSIQEEGV
jgi:hypothetical protein